MAGVAVFHRGGQTAHAAIQEWRRSGFFGKPFDQVATVAGHLPWSDSQLQVRCKAIGPHPCRRTGGGFSRQAETLGRGVVMKPVEQRGRAIIKRLPKGAAVAEVGVLLGVLSEYLLRQRPDISLLMIDNWQTADKQPEAYKETGDLHAHHTEVWRVEDHRRQAENRARHFPGRAEVMAMSSVEAAALVSDGSLDLVFLDADHSYEGVKADLAAWVPKVRRGGWIGGHDYQNHEPGYDFSGVKRAVDEWSTGPVETDLNFTWFARIA